MRYDGRDMTGVAGDARESGRESLACGDMCEFINHVASSKAEAYRVFCSLLPIYSFRDESPYLDSDS